MRSTPANVSVEFTLTAAQPHPDPFNTVTLDGVFTHPDGQTFRVPAFWAGGDTWKVRYASPMVGRHTWRSEASCVGDDGLHGVTGEIEVTPYTGENPLYLHGPVRAAANRRYLVHTDGTPFFWLGDTWWMGLCTRLPWPDGFQKLAADRKAKGFNVVQIVAGLYPDMPAFDPRGANEAGFPWTDEYGSIRPEYFDAADIKLRHLVESGLVPCLVGAWGYFIPWMGAAKLQQHWRYLIARYAAWPMAWCIAGEANLPWYLAPKFPYDDREQVREWTKVTRYVRKTDPFHRPITIHPTAINRYTARHATDDEALLDFDMLQTPHAQNEGVPVMVRALRDSYTDPLTLPLINGEPCYEMLGDSLLTAWPRRAFWSCLMNGSCGHTYGANGIWQCNQPNQPHGNSPWGGGYGKITWEQAMNLPGSTQIALGRNLLTSYPWHEFTPHPEWASFADLKWLPLDGAQWIWLDAAQPGSDAPNRSGWFRRAFNLPDGRSAIRTHLRFAGASHLESHLNGSPSGTGWDRHIGSQFEGLAGLLRPGENTLALRIEYRPASKDPVGFLACLEITLDDGTTLRIATDSDWQCSDMAPVSWPIATDNDVAWRPATALGPLGNTPWGPIGEPDPSLFGPQSAGIPGKVRVHYTPHPQPVVLRQLTPGKTCRAYHFDPVRGQRTPLDSAHANANGEWICPPPDYDHDWVVVVEEA